MMQTIMDILKKPAAITGILTAVVFQVFFSLIWITGYNNINHHVDQLKIAIVNEDSGAGKQAADRLASSLPFQTSIDASLEAAKNRLDRRDVQMIIHIPSTFTQDVLNPAAQGKVRFLMNESNTSMVKSVMQSAAEQVTAELNKQSLQAGLQAAFEQARVPQQQAQGMAGSLSSRVEAEYESIHTVSNFANLMVPMLLVMASFIGSMLMGMNLNKASNEVRERYGKWTRFVARTAIILASSVVIALIGTTMVTLLGVKPEQGFVVMWLFQVLYVVAFMFTAQICLLLFGDAGAWVNIALLSIQLLSSGAMIPREVLSPFYHGVSQFLPSTYAVDGIMNLVNGGPGIAASCWSLLWITLAAFAVGAAAVALHKEYARKSAVPAV